MPTSPSAYIGWWSGLFLVLFVTSFGPSGCLLVLTWVGAAALGVLISLFVLGKEWTEEYWNKASISRLELPDNGIPVVKEEVFRLIQAESEKSASKFDRRLTGCSIIDEHLQEVLYFTLRDYVLHWYRRISDDERFPNVLQESAQQIIIALAKRAKEVDWVQFFTIQLVEDFAAHFRLFRQAQHILCAKKRTDPKNQSDVLSVFFELENDAHHGDQNKTRKRWNEICTSPDEEKAYLRDLVEILLYLLLPADDFNNKTFRCLARELVVNAMFLPTIQLLSDPDYVNQTIVWLCKDVPLTSEGFITVLRLTNNVDELSAVQEKVNHEIAVQRSKDSGGEDDAVIKQQLSSLLFVKRVVDHRLHRLQEGVDTDSAGLPARFDWTKVMSAGYKLYALPLDVILKNNIALSYFIDFMMCIGQQAYMFFYLTVEGYRVSAEQQMSETSRVQDEMTSTGHDELGGSGSRGRLEALREEALNIYEQYLSSKADPRIKVDEGAVKRLWQRIQTEEQPSDNWFDEIQARVLEILSEERYFGAFRKSPQYIKMLAELDLLKDTSKSEDDDLQSLEDLQNQANSDSMSMSSQEEGGNRPSSFMFTSVSASSSSRVPSRNGDLSVKAKIVGTGLVKDAPKPYVVYAVEVIKSIDGDDSGSKRKEDKWQVYRRYNDFHEFHMTIVEKFPNLVGYNFPGKKTFNNLNPEFLGKRMQQLNDYLLFLLKTETCANHPGLQEHVLSFLELASIYSKGGGRGTTGVQLARKVHHRVVNPIREGVRNVGHMVKAVPDSLIQTVDSVMDGLCRVLHSKGDSADDNALLGLNEALRMTAGIDLENDEDIPLRILLVLVDEVFDLKSRNQWLRRRIVVLLREFIKTMYGDRINRKIVDYVEWLTSPEQIAEYVVAFRNSIWPNGTSAQNSPARDEGTRMRTRVAAKTEMICFLPDEMKHIIGSETTRKGVHLLFEVFQQSALNRRLLYEIIERVLQLIFPENNIVEVLRKLHSKPSTTANNRPSKSTETKGQRK